MDNLCLLCSAHHRLHHLGRFSIEMVDGAPTFISADGEIIGHTVDPQFPDVSAESLDPVTPPPPASRGSVCSTHTPEEISSLLRQRQAWGVKRADRVWKHLLEPQE